MAEEFMRRQDFDAAMSPFGLPCHKHTIGGDPSVICGFVREWTGPDDELKYALDYPGDFSRKFVFHNYSVLVKPGQYLVFDPSSKKFTVGLLLSESTPKPKAGLKTFTSSYRKVAKRRESYNE